LINLERKKRGASKVATKVRTKVPSKVAVFQCAGDTVDHALAGAVR